MSFNKAEFVVTRQRPWPDGIDYVEIAQGGHDYSNPGCLAPKYGRLGEGDVFTGMTDAVNAAIAIYKAWDQNTNEIIGIAVGCTHGDTMFFDAEPLDEESEKALLAKAEEFDSKLDRCCHCGKILGSERYRLVDHFDDEEFCSQYCAEESVAPTDEEENEDDEEETDDEECVSEV